MSKDAFIGLRLPESMKLKLEEKAWIKRIPASELLRRIAQNYLDEEGQDPKETAPKPKAA